MGRDVMGVDVTCKNGRMTGERKGKKGETEDGEERKEGFFMLSRYGALTTKQEPAKLIVRLRLTPKITQSYNTQSYVDLEVVHSILNIMTCTPDYQNRGRQI